MKSDVERGPVGAWAYNTRTRLELSVEQVIAALPTRYSTSTLRKGEGGSGHIGVRMRREMYDYFRAEGLKRDVPVTPPPGLGLPDEAATSSRDGDVAAALRSLQAVQERQATALEALVEELRGFRAEGSVAAVLRAAPVEQIAALLVDVVESVVAARAGSPARRGGEGRRDAPGAARLPRPAPEA